MFLFQAGEQIVIDELSTHTDHSRREIIHPYKTLYGRSLQLVLKDNLGDNWEEACITLMSEMRMFELECLRRRMEDKKSETLQRLAQSQEEVLDVEEITFAENPGKYSGGKTNNNGTIGGKTGLEEIIEEPSKSEENDGDHFTGHSCLLVTWKTNPEVEKFKVEKKLMNGRKKISISGFN